MNAGTETLRSPGVAVLDAARALGETIGADAEEISRERRLTRRVLDGLRHAGVFRMPVLREHGGLELSPLEIVRVIDEIAYHDGSTGWVSMICCDSGFYASLLPDQSVARALFADPNLLTSGWLSPAGRAEIIDGGFRVSGRWSFGSGIMHADHVVGGCLATVDGALQFVDGKPHYLAVILPKADLVVHDVWHTTGLRGTSSNDYSVADALVPSAHAFNPFDVPVGNPPLHSYRGLIWGKLTGVPTGLLRRAIDEFETLCTSKLSATMTKLKDEPRAQVAIAAAKADLDACYGLIDRTLGAVWSALQAGDQPSVDQRAALARTVVWVAQTARASIERLAEEAGTAAVMEDNVFERIRRDATMVTHHVVGQRKSFAMSGQMSFGIAQPFPIF